MFRRFVVSLFAAAIASSTLLAPALAAPQHASVTLTGAGSTFDYPFFTKAFDYYCKHDGVCVNYAAIGSGAGIQQFTAKTVNFGASDVPMNPTSELLAAVKAGGSVEQIPVALGGVAMAYNIPGVKTGLHLTGSVIASIYLGLITKWNATAIKKLNPKVHLPNLQITVTHRSDSSGTSYIFTDYLAEISDAWRGQVGVGKSPNWPTGVGGKGNPGVAATVQQIPGAIGYVELAYVLQNHMKEAMVQNSSHKFQFPTLKTVASAAAHFPHVSAKNFSIVNAKGSGSYPIAGYSWALLFKHQTSQSTGKALVKLMKWLVTTGQKYASKLDYVPLPKKVQALGLADLKAVKL